MSGLYLVGVDGSNPLGFLAALGLLRVVSGARLAFATDGSFRAVLEGTDTCRSEIVTLIATDAATNANPSWRLTYRKAATKKQGAQEVADLKPPPEDFKKFLTCCLDQWMKGDDESAAYAAAFATDVACDNNGNTKPTALHFTAAHQTFLGTVEAIRDSLTKQKQWIEQSLFHGHCLRPGKNLRWDPGSDRNWALMAGNPNDDGTSVNAPLEWLAFRGLPLLPCFPRGTRIITTGVQTRPDGTTFTWPLWSVPASLHAVRSALQLDWTSDARERAERGVFAVCNSKIRRTGQGFGNFGPTLLT